MRFRISIVGIVVGSLALPVIGWSAGTAGAQVSAPSPVSATAEDPSSEILLQTSFESEFPRAAVGGRSTAGIGRGELGTYDLPGVRGPVQHLLRRGGSGGAGRRRPGAGEHGELGDRRSLRSERDHRRDLDLQSLVAHREVPGCLHVAGLHRWRELQRERQVDRHQRLADHHHRSRKLGCGGECHRPGRGVDRLRLPVGPQQSLRRRLCR